MNCIGLDYMFHKPEEFPLQTWLLGYKIYVQNDHDQETLLLARVKMHPLNQLKGKIN